MPCVRALLLAGAAALAGAACAGGDRGDRDGELVEGEGPGDPGSGGLVPPLAKAEPDPVEPLADGSHSVFGLRVPRGMRPVPGPHKVYRFDGTLQLKDLKRYVMRQVETGTLLEESTGYLIRKARVLEPVGTREGNLLLAVRIFRGQRGGASMDVWIEAESLAGLRGQGGSGTAGGGVDDEERPRPRLSSTAAARRAEQRKQTFEAIEAAAQGKDLPRDPESPLSY